MKKDHNNMKFQEVGKGFIVVNSNGFMGRMLTKTFVDQQKNTYIKVDGQFTLLTDEYSFLAAE
jgi:hypothetical protein